METSFHTPEVIHPESQITEWNGEAVYQVYPWSFAEDGRAQGEGNLKGVTDKLDYLSDIGVGAIWISPFYPSPMKDGGYDIENYTDVDKRFGTLQDFDELLENAHEKDIKIIVDVVANHSSDQHPWFQESLSPESATSDWYIWKDPKQDEDGNALYAENGTPLPPNNWGSVFSIGNRQAYERGELELETTEDGEEYIPYKSAWIWNEQRQQFYLADFRAEQPNLNWANPEVRDAMKDVLRFWLDRGVDGFRMDVIDHIGTDPEFKDDSFTPDTNIDNPYDQTGRENSIRHLPELVEYVDDLLSVTDEKKYQDRNIRIVFESHADQSFNADNLDTRKPEIAGSFNFSSLYSEWKRSAKQQTIEDYLASLPQDAIPNFVNSNHDVDRLATRIGRAQARACGVLTLSLPGIIYIYQGEEGGFMNVDIPEDKIVDDAGFRDGERTPMMWDDTVNAGFSKADPESLWLPVDPNYKQINLERQATEPNSHLNLYKGLINARKNSDILRLGSYQPIPTNQEDVYAFARTHNGERTITAVNFSGSEQTVRLQAAGFSAARTVMSASNIGDRGMLHDVEAITIAPHDAHILAPSA